MSGDLASVSTTAHHESETAREKEKEKPTVGFASMVISASGSKPHWASMNASTSSITSG
jgi:hypothetical protein